MFPIKLTLNIRDIRGFLNLRDFLENEVDNTGYTGRAKGIRGDFNLHTRHKKPHTLTPTRIHVHWRTHHTHTHQLDEEQHRKPMGWYIKCKRWHNNIVKSFPEIFLYEEVQTFYIYWDLYNVKECVYAVALHKSNLFHHFSIILVQRTCTVRTLYTGTVCWRLWMCRQRTTAYTHQ